MVLVLNLFHGGNIMSRVLLLFMLLLLTSCPGKMVGLLSILSFKEVSEAERRIIFNEFKATVEGTELDNIIHGMSRFCAKREAQSGNLYLCVINNTVYIYSNYKYGPNQKFGNSIVLIHDNQPVVFLSKLKQHKEIESFVLGRLGNGVKKYHVFEDDRSLDVLAALIKEGQEK